MFGIPLCKCSFFLKKFWTLQTQKVIIVMDISSVNGCHGNGAEGQPTGPFCSGVGQEQSWLTQAYFLSQALLRSAFPNVQSWSQQLSLSDEQIVPSDRRRATVSGSLILKHLVFLWSNSDLSSAKRDLSHELGFLSVWQAGDGQFKHSWLFLDLEGFVKPRRGLFWSCVSLVSFRACWWASVLGDFLHSPSTFLFYIFHTQSGFGLVNTGD